MADIQLNNVSKRFGNVDVIDDLSLEIKSNEFVVFLGPSGCGKSTLLRMIAGLETATSGEIFIGGERVDHLPPGQRGVAMVFQNYALYPHMKVRDNLAFGLQNIKLPQNQIEERIVEAARILEIDELLDRRPAELSGGQRQRVAIGRAIVKHPKAFLFDEPLSNLDAALRVRTRVELAELHSRVNATMIYVTHDQVEAMTMADRIVVLNNRKIEQIGTPMEIYNKPASRFVAGFVGSPAMNFAPITLKGLSDSEFELHLPDGTKITSRFNLPTNANNTNHTLGIRPEAISIVDDAEGSTRAKATVVERLGERTLVHVQLKNGLTMIAQDRGTSPVRTGDNVNLAFNVAETHLFDATGKAYHAV